MNAHAPAVEMANVTKSYQGREVVKALTLEVERGTFFSILGPSGCGKTTTLRMLGGFARPDSGEIRLGGQAVNSVPPHRRNVNTVFQSYALFGHLSVADNVAFGLKRKRVPRVDIGERVRQMLRVVSLEDRANANPRELSGGQQQRVALARALVNSPDLLLLDEPLGALDLRLRRQMQVELKHIQREVGVAFVYVTHDQEEALTMSDVVAVMNDGIVLQTGTPREIYDVPHNLFVAQFIGSTNTLTGHVSSGRVDLDIGVALPNVNADTPSGEQIVACIRPQMLTLEASRATPSPGHVDVQGHVTESVFLGADINHVVTTLSGQQIQVLMSAHDHATKRVGVGDEVTVSWHPSDCRIYKGSDGWLLE